MEPPHSTIEFVRPGRATHVWIASTVRELKGGDPLAPVTLVVPNYYAGRQIRWTLAGEGGYVNVRSMLLGDVAEQIVGVETGGQHPLSPVLEQSAVRWVPVRSVFAVFEDDELASALPARAAAELRDAIRSIASVVRARSSQAAEPPIVVIRAPDPSEEVREVVRAIARELDAHEPVPLHRMAVVYRQTDPYAP